MTKAGLVLALIAGACAASGAFAIETHMSEPANKMRRGQLYPDIRKKMIAIGWRAEPTTMSDATNMDRCLGHRRVCEAYPETSHCWMERGQTFCSFDLRDPEGNFLYVKARLDRAGRLLYHDHTFFSEGGSG